MRAWMGIMVVAALTFAACGGDGAEPTSTTSDQTTDTSVPTDPGETIPAGSTVDDPCGILTESEMTQILGFEVTATVGVPSPTSCDYASQDSGGISLDVQNVAGDGCEPVFAVAGYGSDGGEPVDGVGTYAKFGGGIVPQLAVCFDDEVTLIASLGSESADPQATLVAVAQAFEANLP